MNSLQTAGRPASLTLTSAQMTRLVDEYELQVSVMHAQDLKSTYAFRVLADLWRKNILTTQEVLLWMEMLDQTTEFEGPIGQAWSQFVAASIERFIDTMIKADVMSAKNVLRELERTLYLTPIQPKRRGVVMQLLDKLFSRGAP